MEHVLIIDGSFLKIGINILNQKYDTKFKIDRDIKTFIE